MALLRCFTRCARMHTLRACWGGWGCFYTGVAAMLRIALTPAYNRESHPMGVIYILCAVYLCGHCTQCPYMFVVKFCKVLDFGTKSRVIWGEIFYFLWATILLHLGRILAFSI